MGLATTGGAEVEGESQVKKSRRAIGTGGRLAGLRLRLRLRLAGWLLYSIFIGHARSLMGAVSISVALCCLAAEKSRGLACLLS